MIVDINQANFNLAQGQEKYVLRVIDSMKQKHIILKKKKMFKNIYLNEIEIKMVIFQSICTIIVRLKPSNILSLFDILLGACPRGVMVKTLDCGIIVSEFELQSRNCAHFRASTLRKGMNPLILQVID